MVSTRYQFEPNPSRHKDHNNSYVFEHLAPYENWTACNQKLFTPQINFSGPFVFGLHTVALNTKFQAVDEKPVHHDIYKRFWDDLHPNFTKNSIFENRKFTSQFSLHLFSNLKTAFTIGPLRINDPLIEYYSFTPKNLLIDL